MLKILRGESFEGVEVLGLNVSCTFDDLSAGQEVLL